MVLSSSIKAKTSLWEISAFAAAKILWPAGDLLSSAKPALASTIDSRMVVLNRSFRTVIASYHNLAIKSQSGLPPERL